MNKKNLIVIKMIKLVIFFLNLTNSIVNIFVTVTQYVIINVHIKNIY